jgi:hypothetical protein
MLSKYLQLACIALVVHGWAHAQDTTAYRYTISAGGAYERSVFENDAKLSTPLITNVRCPCTGPASSNGPARGYSVRMSISHDLLAGLTAGARFELSRLTGSSVWHQYDHALLLEGSGGIPVNQRVVWREGFTMETVRFDLLARYRLPIVSLTFEAGVTAAHRRFILVRRTLDIDEPDNARFKNPEGVPVTHNGRRLVYYEGTWPESNHFVPGALVGLSWTIPVIGDLAVVPEVLLRTEFTPPSDEPWPSFFASFGASAAYRF